MHASATSSYATPQRVRGATSMLSTGVRDLACGDSFTVLVDGKGELWGWGDNSRGQLSRPTLSRLTTATADAIDRALIPTRLDAAPAGGGSAGLGVVHSVAAGHSHCIAISDSRDAWSWGWNEYGQLGLENFTPFHYRPQKVEGALVGKICTAVACGERHSVVAAHETTRDAADHGAQAYSFGSNSNGQLGTAKEKGQMGFVECSPTPQHVVLNPDLEFGLQRTRKDAGATPRSRSPAAVRRRAQQVDQSSYLGGGDYSGGGPRPNVQRLNDHPSEFGLSVRRLACGARHTLAVVERTRGRGRQFSVWAWGQNSKGQLGLASNAGVAAAKGCGAMAIPHRVAAMDEVSGGDLAGVEIACGAAASYVALGGHVYSCASWRPRGCLATALTACSLLHAGGNNHAGQLGTSTESQDSIHLISKQQRDTDVIREVDMSRVSQAGAGDRLMCVAAGGDHASVWADSSSSAVLADGSAPPRRFEDCSLPKKCEIAVMGHDCVLLEDCIQVRWPRWTAHSCASLTGAVDSLSAAIAARRRWKTPSANGSSTFRHRGRVLLARLATRHSCTHWRQRKPPPLLLWRRRRTPPARRRSRLQGGRAALLGTGHAHQGARRAHANRRARGRRSGLRPRPPAPPRPRQPGKAGLLGPTQRSRQKRTHLGGWSCRRLQSGDSALLRGRW